MIRIACIAILLGCVTRASAEPPQSEADRLFEEGRALAKEKRWTEACDRFERSFLLDPTIGTTLNFADCREQLGHVREAWQLFDAALQKLAATDDVKRTQFARERRDAAAKRLGTIVVKIAPPQPSGLEVVVAGRDLPIASEMRELVDPGEVLVVATVPGRPQYTTTTTVMAGATIVVAIPAFGDRRDRLPEVPTTTRLQRTRVRIAWGVAGGAGAGAIAAVALTLKARSDYNAAAGGPHCMDVVGGITCDVVGDRAIADAQGIADIATGFAVASGVLLGTAAVLYFTAPREPVRLVPSLGGDGAGISLHGQF